jgi:hypothetical protein
LSKKSRFVITNAKKVQARSNKKTNGSRGTISNGLFNSILLGPCGFVLPKNNHDFIMAGKSYNILAVSAKNPPLGITNEGTNPDDSHRDFNPNEVNLKKS